MKSRGRRKRETRPEADETSEAAGLGKTKRRGGDDGRRRVGMGDRLGLDRTGKGTRAFPKGLVMVCWFARKCVPSRNGG